MSKAEQIRNYVYAHPGATTPEIAKAVGVTVERASSILSSEVMHKRNPLVIRRVARHLPTGTPVYAYFKAPPALENKEPVVLDKEPVVLDKPKRKHKNDNLGLDHLAEQLARAFAQQVAIRVKNHLSVALADLVPDAAPIMPSLDELKSRLVPATPAVKRKHVVLIAGLLPMQAGIIEQELGDAFDFKFFESSENLHKLRSMVDHADYLFTFTSKIPHAVEEIMKASGKPIHRCSGGLTMLKDMLTKLYVETT
jgi:hypothetical protein